jgi:outer membrane protein assembly factor BamB
MPTPFISNSRRRRRRWPLILAVVVVLLAGGGLAVYLIWGKKPGDVSNPNAEFSDTQDQQTQPNQAPAKKKKGETFIWGTYGYGATRTRYLNTDLKPPFKPLWKYAGGDLIEFQPILAKGTLYFLKNHGIAIALSAKTGHVRWQQRVGQLNASSPTYANGKLYLTTLAPGQVLCLNAKTGKIIWRKPLPSRTESSPLYLNNRVYFGSENGTVYAVKAKDGSNVWTHRAGGAVKGALAYSSGKLYFGAYGGSVTALKVSDGSVAWSAGTAGRSFGRAGNFYGTAAVAYGRVYLGNTDGKVYSFVASNGQLAWSHSTGAYVYAAAAVARVPGTKPSVYIGSYDGHFYSLDARSGKQNWSYSAGGKISGAPSVIGSVVYFSNLAAKETSGLDAKTGKRVFKIKRGAFNPVISDGKRLYLTGYSSQYALVPK